jgi:hypothetical protein
LLHHLRALAEGAAVFPDLLQPLLDDSDDEPFDDTEIEAAAVLGRQFLELENERRAESARADEAEAKARKLAKERDTARNALKAKAAPQSVRGKVGKTVRRARRVAGRAKRRLRAAR